MIKMRTSTAIVLLLCVCGCKVGPNYKRPTVSVPDQYRGVAPDLSNTAATEPFGQMKWQSVFQDDVLQGLIKEGITNNYDIRIAATRIEQARDVVGITRANQLPSINGVVGVQNQQGELTPGSPTIDTVGISLNYIVDFWGQYRRATEAAKAQLLSSTYARDVVLTTLISNIATSYYQLREFDSQLEFAKKTLEADNEILRINTVKFKGGESAITDVYQADLLVQQAQAQVVLSQEGIAQTENQISILLGRNPGAVSRGLALVDQPHLAVIPAGIPSSILERRPDVLSAEQNLVAANANVGVAKAAFFPQISLTGEFGAQSTAVTSFLQGPATFWAIGGQLAQPLYQGGRIRANYDLAWAQRDEAELRYKQAVQNAFGDVANTLVGYNQSRLYRGKIEEQTSTYRETARLANVRFNGGATSFLEVLVTEQQYFTSELALAQAWNTEMQNYVQLYQALGGGWQP
jgi:outer membrane protein, multidrug efflux system